MKLTHREKRLIYLLAAALLFYGYYRWVLLGQQEKLKALEIDHDHYQRTLEQYQARAATEPQLDQEIATLGGGLETLIHQYFTGIIQEDILQLLNQFIEASRLPVTRMEFTPTEPVALGQVELNTMKAVLSFTGEFNPVMDFLAQVKGYERKILIERVQINSQQLGNLSGAIELRFYSLPAAFQEAAYLYLWDQDNKTNRSHPFYTPVPIDPITFDRDQVHIQIGDSRVLLADFESNGETFIPYGRGVTGRISPSTLAITGEGALQLEYSFPRSLSSLKARVLLSDGLILAEPPASLRLWVYSYGSSNTGISLTLLDANRQTRELFLTRKVDWTGWKQLEVSLPTSGEGYPLQVVGIEITNSPGLAEDGILILDGLEAVYPAAPVTGSVKQVSDSAIYYQVQPGDTLTAISEKFYGHPYGGPAILSTNGLTSEGQLQQGKILVIPVTKTE